MKTEVIEAPMTKSIDTVVVKARPKPHRPQVDTTRVPIGFDPSVEDWEEYIPPVVEYTEEELLEEAKKNKIEEILMYDSSDSVNIFLSKWNGHVVR